MPRSILSLALLSIAPVGLIGCVGGGDETVVILQNNAPEEGCVISASVSDSYIGNGRIEVASPSGYLLTPVAKNDATGETEDTNRIAFVDGIQVDLEFPADEALEAEYEGSPLTRFEIGYSAIINPGATTSFIAEVVPAELLEELEDDVDGDSSVLVRVHTRLVGELGGSGFESSSFSYDVEVCEGCLVSVYSSCAVVPAEVNSGGECNPFQDYALDCCINSVGDTICPAVTE